MTPRRAALAVGALACVVFAVLSTCASMSHLGWHTQMNDLGNFDQALFRLVNGDLSMRQTNTIDGVPRSRLGVHLNFVFYLLAPLYALVRSPLVFLIVSAAAVALGGVALWLFARRRLREAHADERLALCAPLAFWLSPLVHDAALYDGHTTTWSAAALCGALWRLDAGATRSGACLVVLAVLCKEDVALVAAGLGIALAVDARVRGAPARAMRVGLALAAAALAWFAIELAVVVPLVTGGGTLEKLGGADNAFPLLRTDAVVGEAVADRLSRSHALRMPITLLVGGGLLAFGGGGRFLLPALPPIVVGALASGAWMTRPTGTYYWPVCAAFVVAAVAASAAAKPARRSRLITLVGVSAVLSALFSPLPYSAFADATQLRPAPAADRRALADAIARVPPDALLCVQNNLGPWASRRDRVASLSRCHASGQPRYALLALAWRGGTQSPLFARTDVNTLLEASPRRLIDVGRRALEAPDTVVMFHEAGVWLFALSGAAAGPATGTAATSEDRAAYDADAARFLEELDATRSTTPSWVAWLLTE